MGGMRGSIFGFKAFTPKQVQGLGLEGGGSGFEAMGFLPFTAGW